MFDIFKTKLSQPLLPLYQTHSSKGELDRKVEHLAEILNDFLADYPNPFGSDHHPFYRDHPNIEMADFLYIMYKVAFVGLSAITVLSITKTAVLLELGTTLNALQIITIIHHENLANFINLTELFTGAVTAKAISLVGRCVVALPSYSAKLTKVLESSVRMLGYSSQNSNKIQKSLV